MLNTTQKVENKDALKFILGGKSEFTMHSLKTGKDLAYKIVKKETNDKEDKFIYFMSYNIKYEDYMYGGVIFYNEFKKQFEFKQGRKGNASADSQVVKSILFVLNKLNNDRFNIPVEVYHHCKCGRCGRALTTPSSVLTGLGEWCASRVGVPYMKISAKIS
jgi:hypothetical protein